MLVSVSVFSQNTSPVGEFEVKNFSSNDYGGSPQNLDIVQSKDQHLILANSGGLIEFDGEHWNKFAMPNEQYPRSLCRASDGTIYAGGVNSIARLDYSDNGLMKTVSLDLDTDEELGDVWGIHEANETIYFVFRKHIATLALGETLAKVESLEEGESIIRSFSSNDRVYLQIKNKQEELSLKVISVTGQITIPAESYVSGITELNNQTHVFWYTGEISVLKFEDEEMFYESSAIDLSLAEGSRVESVLRGEGVVAINVSGQGVNLYSDDIRFIRSINESSGLSNLLIHKMLFDQYGNLWLCNDNGVSFVELSSPVTSFDQDKGISGMTEDIHIQDNRVNLATHIDLLQLNLKDKHPVFRNTGTFNMDVFQIREFTFSDGVSKTLCILNEGISVLTEDNQEQIIDRTIYAWDLCQSSINPDRIYIGLDGDGVGSMLYQDGAFIYEGRYPNTSGEVRSVIELDGSVYYTVKFEGVYRLDTTHSQAANLITGLVDYSDSSATYKQFDMALFEDKLYVGTAHGLYHLVNGTLMPFEGLDGRFHEKNLLIHRLISTEDGRLWMVMFHNAERSDEIAEIGYLEASYGDYRWVSSPFRQLTDDVIFTISRQNDQFYWIGGGEKVYVYNNSYQPNFDQSFKASISKITVNKDSVYCYSLDYTKRSAHDFDYHNNTFTFEFSSTAYLGGITNEYSFYLEGEDEGWSEWTTTNSAVYQRLSEGEYTFHVKARNYYNFESEISSFRFVISPPWYRTAWAYIGYFVLGILIIYIIIRISIRRVKRQNERLEEIVEERTAEIAHKNEKLELQKAEIEEKTNDILDSIKYAKRIQNTILPDDNKLSTIFDHDHFVLYRPKDIVSGDFYWATRYDNTSLFSVIDCTGHGVPGAFVSIVGHNGLNRAVNEFNLRQPGAILDKLADVVIDNFTKQGSNIKDGMDLALCALDNDTLKLQFAGAHNPLIIIREGEIIEVKANKQPIGEFENRVPFKNHEIQLLSGDCIYIYSDGYADQFGGDRGKKLKAKNLKSLLLKVAHLPMQEQKNELDRYFDKWKTGFEQLDDVCVMGIKIK